MDDKEKTAEILANARARIDALDQQLIDTLAARFDVVRDVAALKRAHHIAVVQQDRVRQVLDNAARYAAAKNLDPNFAKSVVQLCIDHAHVMEPVWMEKDTQC